MTYTKSLTLKVLSLLAAVVFLGAAGVAFTRTASANPLGFSCPAYGPGGVASTSVTYMTGGTGTTTLLYDTYCVGGSNQPNTGNTSTTNLLSLLTQFTASSTASVLNTSVEYSQDGVDWYQDNYVASTTAAYSLQTANSTSWTFASSTPGGGAAVANSNRVGKLTRLYAPTRYVRVVYTLAASGTAGGVWGEILPIKERP